VGSERLFVISSIFFFCSSKPLKYAGLKCSGLILSKEGTSKGVSKELKKGLSLTSLSLHDCAKAAAIKINAIYFFICGQIFIGYILQSS